MLSKSVPVPFKQVLAFTCLFRKEKIKLVSIMIFMSDSDLIDFHLRSIGSREIPNVLME